MKSKTVVKTEMVKMKVFTRICPECKYPIRGRTESHLDYNFTQHIEAHQRGEEAGEVD